MIDEDWWSIPTNFKLSKHGLNELIFTKLNSSNMVHLRDNGRDKKFVKNLININN